MSELPPISIVAPAPRVESAPLEPLIICSMMRSMGPPGASWTIMKLITMMPNSVGTISASRRRT